MLYTLCLWCFWLEVSIYGLTVVNGFELPQFPDGSPWTMDISDSTDVHTDSAQITAWLKSQGGWGNGNVFQIDRSINVLQADCATPRVPFVKKDDYYHSDCDDLDMFPIPTQGALEGETEWDDVCSGDCHLLVYDGDSGLLWESWSTNVTVDGEGTVVEVTSTCAVVWNTSHLYPSSGRGEGCTSSDAAGFPISSLLFTADEIKKGEINHAIRFILPNERMRAGYYVHPGSHFGTPEATNQYSPIYGSRWRLKASFDISSFSAEAQVVLRALKKYGMFLADGGNIALTAMSDLFNSDTTWDEAGLGTKDLNGVHPEHFDVMNGFGSNPVIGYNDPWPDCVPNDIPIDTAPCCDCNSGKNQSKDGNNLAGSYLLPVLLLSQFVWIAGLFF